MVPRERHGGYPLLIAAALALGLSAFPASTALAHGGGGGGGHGGGGMGGGHMGGMGGGHMGGMGGGHMGGYGHMGYGHMGYYGHHHPGYGYGYGGLGYGGLGYGGFGGLGFFPGFFGYGMGYGYPFLGAGYGGLGYGYGMGGYGLGGYGMGYGLGGYGMGYGSPYYGGYDYPYYGSVGYGYGVPYASNMSAAPVAGATYSSAYVAPSGSAVGTTMPQGRYLGIDEEPVTDSNGRRGMKVINVYPGTPAQRAGLRVGDVIYSINGYLTEQRGNLAWIIANAAPTNQLNIDVKRSSDGQERSITAQLNQ